jgi:small nuclear ribonucleoprotein D3
MCNGQVFRGLMVDAEDNWNCQMQNCTVTDKEGKVAKMQHTYLRGSKIRLIILPDMMRNAPMFRRFDPKNKQRHVGIGMGTIREGILGPQGYQGGAGGGGGGGGRGGGR